MGTRTLVEGSTWHAEPPVGRVTPVGQADHNGQSECGFAPVTAGYAVGIRGRPDKTGHRPVPEGPVWPYGPHGRTASDGDPEEGRHGTDR